MVSFLLGLTSALLLGVERSLASAQNKLRESLVAAVFFQASLSDDEAQKISDSLTTIDPAINSVRFISRQEALMDAQNDPALSRSIVILKENPLPASAVLTYRDTGWLQRSEPGEALRTVPQIQEIRWDASTRTSFRTFHQWRAWLIRLGGFSTTMLIVWAFFGLYRFLALRSPLSELGLQILVGIVGGGIALGLWVLALNQVGVDASLYRPQSASWFPLLTGAIVGLASFGLEARQ